MMFSNAKFVFHYTIALPYKKTKEPVVYIFEINEETYLNEYTIINKYEQELKVDLSYKSSDDIYGFEIETKNNHFSLQENLTQQGKLLEDLAKITEKVEIEVNKEGTIRAVNYDFILKKWKALKTQLLKSHKGNHAEAYINAIDTKIKNESLFLKEIKQVKLLGLLFNGYQAANKKDSPKLCKISNCIHCLPIVVKEKIINTEENKELKEKQIITSGTLEALSTKTHQRIEKYFTYFGVGKKAVFLSKYKRDILLNTVTGYPKSAQLTIELTNGQGYIRKMNFTLKQKNNG